LVCVDIEEVDSVLGILILKLEEVGSVVVHEGVVIERLHLGQRELGLKRSDSDHINGGSDGLRLIVGKELVRSLLGQNHIHIVEFL